VDSNCNIINIFSNGGGGASARSNDGGGSWSYSKEITINNPGAALTDYQVLVTLDGSNFPISAKTSGDDSWFTDAESADEVKK
jgi:hypothetical protein